MEISLQQSAELLEKANAIVLTAHVNPDGDSLGSLLALYQGLHRKGKTVTILLDDVVPPVYRFLPCCEVIRQPDENERHSPDLLVVLDASDIERIGKVRQIVTAPVLNIDHHISNTRFADYTYVEPESSSTGEIITVLLNMMGCPLNQGIGNCLYTAIATDCGFFQYANTSAQTLRHAADLVEAGAQPQRISEALERRPLSSLTTLTKVLQTIELHKNGKVATMVIPENLITDPDESTEGFINYARSVEGVEVAILLKAIAPTTVRVSLRSHRADVSRIALAFGGGGHIRAAGCTIHEKLEKAKEMAVAMAANQIR